MNKIFTIATALLTVVATSSTQAKNGSDAMLTAGVTTGNTFPHFDPVVGGDKGAILKSNHRLISKVYFKHDGYDLMTIDSTTYDYSNGRGGAIDPERPNDDQNILFDNSYTYNYDNNINDYGNRLHRSQQFTDNKVTMLTYTPWRYTSNGWTWKDSARYLYNYATDGRMIESTSELWFGSIWTNSVSSTLQYNTSNNIIKMSSVAYEVEFKYNSNNKIEQVVDKRLTGGFVLENSERKTYTYNGNDIASYELEAWSTSLGVWVRINRWEYTYVSGTDKLDEELVYEWNNGWVLTKRINYDYDSKNNLSQILTERWDAAAQQYINDKREKWEYNVDDLPTKMERQTWTGSSWGYAYGDEVIHYRYERYFPTSVNTIASADDMLNVFPVPANNTVNVNWDKHYNYNIAVVDMAGRVVLNSNANSNTQLSVNNLPNGNYFVKVSDGADRMVKQIVVAH